MSHNEHCKKCKTTFLKALETEYGEVIEQWQSGWPCKIEDIRSIPHLSKARRNSIIKIYKAIQRYRGYDNFVRRKALPRCDYFIKSLNCIVEFDESQHFTSPRALTYSLYPKWVKAGYDKNIWKIRCEGLNRRDSDPIYRDEQRAWYDTLRDVFPNVFGMNPTIRIYAKDNIWCLDKNATIKTLKDNILKFYKL